MIVSTSPSGAAPKLIKAPLISSRTPARFKLSLIVAAASIRINTVVLLAIALHAITHTPTILQTGSLSNPTQQLGHVIASKAPALATEAGANLSSKSAAKASLKTTSKAAFEAGYEAAINGTILGAVGGVAFGVSLLVETPFYIRGAYKLGRKKKFDVI